MWKIEIAEKGNWKSFLCTAKWNELWIIKKIEIKYLKVKWEMKIKFDFCWRAERVEKFFVRVIKILQCDSVV